MREWLKPLGYSDTINEAAINFVLREFVMSKVSSDSMMNADMVIDLLRPQLEHQTSYISHQPSLGLYHYRDLQAGWYYGQGLSGLCSLRVEPWK